jgi:preprotein translocase subunit SecG
MSVWFTILTVLVIIASVLLTAVVLLQNGKGGGIASNFTAGNQTFGVRQTADILEKVTWSLVAFIFVVSIITNFTLGTSNGSNKVDEMIQNQAVEQQVLEFPAVPVQEDPTQNN